MYSHFPAVCMLISQRKTYNFPPLLKDTLETRNTQIIYLKTQFSTVSSRWSGTISDDLESLSWLLAAYASF